MHTRTDKLHCTQAYVVFKELSSAQKAIAEQQVCVCSSLRTHASGQSSGAVGSHVHTHARVLDARV